MTQTKILLIATCAGLVFTLVGLITFCLSWHFFDVWGGPIPGYGILLYPAKLSLVYLWHPLFTEEIDMLPKLALMLVGQFTVVSFVTAISLFCLKRVIVGR